jgi:hypothetical protein
MVLCSVGRSWSAKNAEKAKQAGCDFLDFVVWEIATEFIPIDGSELIDSLAAELLRWFHVGKSTLTAATQKDGKVALCDIFADRRAVAIHRQVDTLKGLMCDNHGVITVELRIHYCGLRAY